MDNKKVSVIVPTHNRKTLLKRAVESVLAQSYRNIECIVVDDGSQESMAPLMNAIRDDRLRFFRHDLSKGASAARNRGIGEAEGDYISFLDDDDTWEPSKIEKQVSLLRKLSDSYGMVYCWMNYIDEESGSLIKRYCPDHRGWVLSHVLDDQRIGACSTLLARRKVVEEVGGFDENLPRGNDGDFIRRVCSKYKVDYVPESLVQYHVAHGHQRITRSDVEGTLNAINGHKAKLNKFSDLLTRLHTPHSRIHANIALEYGRLGEWRQCARHFYRAIKIDPASPNTYKNAIRLILESVKGLKPSKN